MELKRNEFRAACRGCHGGCVHILTVENGRVTKVRPDTDAPLNHGRACTKGVTIIEQMYSPDRIIYPMRRSGERGGGKWERISWDEAYDTIAERLSALREKYGPECVAMFTGTGRHHMAHFWRFSHVLQTPNGASSGPLVCLDPRVFSGRWTCGTYASVDYFGKTKPAGLLIWGANPAVSGADGELQWFVKDAAKAGAKLIIVDPRPTELTDCAALWLRLRPGTDGALALGILNVIISEGLYDRAFVRDHTFGFEELRARCAEYGVERVSRLTWVPAEKIREAARLIAAVKPMSLEWGCAIEQTVNSIQTCRSLFMLMGLTGSFDVPGGFCADQRVAPAADGLTERMTPELDAKRLSLGVRHIEQTPMAHPRAVLKAMRDGDPYRVRALLIHANNSLLSMPDSRYVYESLSKLEFFVCMDFFMTPTAELADIFLPAALWPELDEVFSMPEFSEQAVLCMQKVAQVGECKSDEEVFLELSRRMGLDYGAESLREIFDGQLEEMSRRRPEYAGMTFERFKEIGYIEPERKYYGYLERGFDTPTGKFELYSKTMESLGADPLPFWREVTESPNGDEALTREYPLVLTTGGRRQQYFISNNRQVRAMRRQAPFPCVTLHPATAAKHGIAEGDWVFIETRRGRITQKAKLLPEMDERVVNCEMGWWYPEDKSPAHGWTESNVNLLTIGDKPFDEFFGSYQLRAMMCRISKNDSRAIEERFYSSEYYQPLEGDKSSDCIVLDPNKCALCGSCVEACELVQGVGALEIVTENGATFVRAKNGGAMAESGCVGCGQCVSVCPEGGIRVKSDLERVAAALDDGDTDVIAQVAPSVRVGIAAALGLKDGENAMGRLTAAMKKAGFAAVHDTAFAADLTAAEESAELLARLERGEKAPLLTSCCPAWVSYCESRYPELSGCISACRSPQQMMGAVLREHYGEPEKGKKRLFVSVMPCTAKKAELKRPESATNGRRDVDASITTRELAELLRGRVSNIGSLSAIPADPPYASGSGGGLIFGVTGGVTEAVLRCLSPRLGEKELRAAASAGERGDAGIKEFTFGLGGRELKIAVASGLKNAAALMERISSGEKFDLVEVMACPGGCVMGGGQPADAYKREALKRARSGGLYEADERSESRRAGDNPAVGETLRGVARGRERELLHRNSAGA